MGLFKDRILTHPAVEYVRLSALDDDFASLLNDMTELYYFVILDHRWFDGFHLTHHALIARVRRNKYREIYATVL